MFSNLSIILFISAWQPWRKSSVMLLRSNHVYEELYASQQPKHSMSNQHYEGPMSRKELTDLAYYSGFQYYQNESCCLTYEPRHDKTNNVVVRPAKTQISLGMRPVWSVFAVRLMGSSGSKVSSCGQWRLWSDWTDAQADLSFRWAHSHFVGFVMSRLIWVSLSVMFVTFAKELSETVRN